MIGAMSRSARRGFTLIELLVATGVFMIGFTAAFSLFLAAMRYRTLAEDTTRLSLAASSLVEELAIGKAVTPPPATPLPPSAYLGGGNLPGVPNTPPGTVDPSLLVQYPGVPGTWFTVETCTDLLGGDDPTSPTLHLNLLVLVDTQDQPETNGTLSLIQINKRMHAIPPTGSTTWNDPPPPAAMFDALIRRGVAMRVSAVVVRRPSWM